MTVYEMIQELAQYPADTKVIFHAEFDFDTDVEAEFDRENEDDLQEVTVTAIFDDDVDFDEITQSRTYPPYEVKINLTY